MAAKELDAMWDGWMNAASDSYSKVLGHTSAGRHGDAAAEFRTYFVPTIKKIYSEAPETYPLRFSKVNDWCGWVRELYVLTIKADRALAANSAEASKPLDSLREHFYKLHQQTETLSAADVIFAFRVELSGANPDAGKLRALCESLETAKPSAKAAREADAYTQARAQWSSSVNSALQDGAVDASELPGLRQATETFYRAYGAQFE